MTLRFEDLPELPSPDLRYRVAMRDGARLDTCVWRPTGEAPAPAILIRTPYSRSVTRVNEAPLLRYLDAGYAVVMQQIRGVGASEGRFAFNAPHDRDDGYDAVEWVAAQPWCTGAVGLDGHSYSGMTQLTAAVARPPHLRCIVPAVPSVDFFHEPAYIGGVFSRMHTLVWGKALQFTSMLDPESGAFAMHGFMTDPSLLDRWTKRPVRTAADGELTGDLLQHYHDVLDHPTLDDWWRARMLQPSDYARMDVPTLVVSGNFDPSVGVLTLWRGLEEHAGAPEHRSLLIGPWDHNGAYNGGLADRGPYRFDAADALDLVALRIAFFDRYLKEEEGEPPFPARVRLFVTGENRWHDFACFPPPGIRAERLFLASEGHANSERGDGALCAAGPAGPPDHFVDDPAWPLVGPLAALRGPDFMLDLRELERFHDVLVYQTGPLEAPLTVLGEAELELWTAADTPDADLVAYLAEARPDGSTTLLGFGQLRLRYREGFDREVPLEPGRPVRAAFKISYVAHRIEPGHRLRLLVCGGNFPLLDPNPHGWGPIADQVEQRPARQTILHDADHPSVLVLPILETSNG